jgi:biotin-(acetyl-CoA carboxylase) ligase
MNLLKPKILRYESLPSTNNEAARLAALGADEGLTVVAEEQTAGRGRLQRTWVSPKGAGLYFSILLLPKNPQDRWPLSLSWPLSQSATLCCNRVISRLTSSGPTIFLQVKEKFAAYWPR